ncbi:MAG: DUF262 domain-containing HNH endonuclease family protein [Terrisporobacter sp.]
MENILNANETTISNYLKISPGKSSLYIPFSQRPYVWGKNELNRFWDDLMDIHVDSKLQHVLNFFTLYSDEQTNKNYIYDGQQRTITSVIVLCVMLAKYKSIYDETKNGDFLEAYNQIKSEHVIKKLAYGADRGKKSVTIKFDDENINDFFELHIIEGNKFGKDELKNETKKNLIKAYEFFNENLERYLDKCNNIDETIYILDNLIEALLTRFIIVVLKTKNRGIAEQMFNTLNTTGKDLELFYIIKNECVTILGDEEVKPNWIKIEENLAGLPKDQFIMYFANIYFGKIKEEDILAEFKYSNLRDMEATRIFIDQLLKAARWYSFCRNSKNDDVISEENIDCKILNNIKSSIEILNNQQFTSYIPTIFAMVLGGYELGDIEMVLKVTECMMIRNKTVLGVSAQFFNNFYPQLAYEISNRSIHRDVIIEKINNEISNDNEIREILNKPFNKKASTLRNILVEIIKMEYPEIIVKTDTSIVNLEHIVPKVITQEWRRDSGEDIEDYIYYIGNLTLISSPKNSELKNGTFQSKKEIYKLSGIPMTKEIGNSEIKIWNKDIIINRTNYLANLFLKRWKKL